MSSRPRFCVFLPAYALFSLLAIEALAADSAPTVTNGGYMEAQIGQRRVVLPLQKTDVHAQVAGVVADVTLKQRFHNSEKQPIEAIYVFPLPHRAAIHGMTITIGKRTIRALVKKRAEAKETYRRARAAGKRAALLEQQRPNIFTQRVANIMPGETIVVTLRYVERLVPDEGRYAFVFPLVVGPRYMGRGAAAPFGRKSGDGWAKDTRRVPDASKISPRLLKKGLRPGHDVDIEVHVAGGPTQLESPSHQTKLRYSGATALVSLAPHDRIPNKDFVLRYRLAQTKPKVTALTHFEKKQGHLLLMVQPPKALAPKQIPPREIVFVVDNSGSMWGFPLEQARTLMKTLLGKLRPQDYFQIIRFAGSPDRFRPASVRANYQNLAAGLGYIANMRGGGGTEFLPALKMAFSSPKPPGRARTVVFITDGYIGYEREVLRYIQGHGKGSTVFSLGVGSSVNRWLIDSMARIGGGTPFYCLSPKQAKKVARQVALTLARPAITDLKIDWHGLPVEEVTPRRLSDLYVDKPVLVLARYRRAMAGFVTLSGRRAGKRFATTIPVVLSGAKVNSAHRAVPLLWARQRIAEEMDRWALDSDAKPQAEKTVTRLALRYQLMSRFTSFVAVDSQVVNRSGQAAKRGVAVPLPAGVSPRAAPPQASAGVLGVLKGGSIGSAYGFGGLGISGSGRGGGGYGSGTIGLGKLGTLGKGGGGGYGAGYGRLSSRRTRAPRVMVARAVVRGSLDRNVIRRIIRRHLNEVRYCYQQQLVKLPKLKGRIVLDFIIDGQGKVTSVKIANSTLNDKLVERCLMRAVRRWRFPSAPGGGIVKVRYPFVFRPAR